MSCLIFQRAMAETTRDSEWIRTYSVNEEKASEEKGMCHERVRDFHWSCLGEITESEESGWPYVPIITLGSRSDRPLNSCNKANEAEKKTLNHFLLPFIFVTFLPSMSLPLTAATVRKQLRAWRDSRISSRAPRRTISSSLSFYLLSESSPRS